MKGMLKKLFHKRGDPMRPAQKHDNFKVEKTAWYVFPALFGHYLAFFGGIMFMLCYYIWFHPTGIEMPFFQFLQVGSRTMMTIER